MQVLAQSSTVQQIAILSEDIANPFLDENHQECCQKTKDEGHEPESIYMDIR